MKKVFKIKAHTHVSGNEKWAYLSDLYRSISNGSFLAMWHFEEGEALLFRRKNPTDEDMAFIKSVAEDLEQKGQAWNVTLVECDEKGNVLVKN